MRVRGVEGTAAVKLSLPTPPPPPPPPPPPRPLKDARSRHAGWRLPQDPYQGARKRALDAEQGELRVVTRCCTRLR